MLALAGAGLALKATGLRAPIAARAAINTSELPPAPHDPITPYYDEPPVIASNFDIGRELHNSDVPKSSLPDTVGAFRFICGPGQVIADDPIVFPGQPGHSHLHQFYGNTSANAFSTYASLRKEGESTCMSRANRSAYWMPAMLDGMNHVVRPDYVSIYYKRFPISSPLCTQRAKACVRVPRGLRFIMGRNMRRLNQPPTGNFHFLCETKGTFKLLAEAAANCVVGKHLIAVIDAPMCWDGRNADSPDHQSHMSYMYDTHKGYPKCPDTHPYHIPTFTLSAAYRIEPRDSPKNWSFSSDSMAPNEPRGSTFHADWFGAWDDRAMAIWTQNCIDKQLNCSDGILGNGMKLNPLKGFKIGAAPRLVPIPASNHKM